MEPTTSTPKVGRISRGWQLTKSAWHVLKLDKELAGLPLISTVVSIGTMLVLGGLYIAVALAFGATFSDGESFGIPGWAAALVGLSFYAVMTIIANFFGAAVIYGATERFNGGNPTLKSSVAGARRKFRPLLLFSLMMATVGFVLQSLEQRLPIAGKIATYLFDAAWSVANLFALPVIVLSEENVKPLDATKRSVGIIKKVWGESIVVDMGIAAVGALTIIGYTVISGLVIFLAGSAGNAAGMNATGSSILVVGLLLIAILGAMVLTLIFSTLSGIAKAALYHYATTGESPAMFNSALLRSSMSPKKARKVFSA